MAVETVTFELFRLRLHEHFSLFPSQISRKAAILLAVNSATLLNYRDHEWRTADLTIIDDDGVYFTFGRKSSISVVEYDPSTGKFEDGLAENWPIVHIFLDARIGLVAISRNGRLSRGSETVANRLKDMLASFEAIRGFWDVDLKAIPDPEGFIEKLNQAFAIKKFSFEFWRPNPFDIDEDLQKPLEEYLLQAGGYKGEVEIEGVKLDPEIIEAQARSAIASSTETKALIQEEANGGTIAISSKDNKFETREISFDVANFDDLRRSLEVIREAYSNIRTG
ncbi:hypothetical protein [Deinococcus sp. JMULE3]|uniref:hypothetical protein n=1 Tax=Deinococcus sp. JMULE3 TaxID=2518341 RepID=UPI001576C5B4|nr:hypothetical protein [Deinococcus sp. JMULE3]NTY02070.1 hypothetical protein [Deinococcus sp. JMULE3]